MIIFIYKIHLLLSPYLEITFTAVIGYYFFLKQFLKEKKSERQSQVQLQKDQLHKEIFDQVSSKIDNSYLALADVKKYCLLLKFEGHTNVHQLDKFFESFMDKYFELDEVIHSLSLTLEKYDFVIDPEQNIIHLTNKLQNELYLVCSEIINLRYESPMSKSKMNNDDAIYEKINHKLNNLSNVCSKINLHLQKLADNSKKLIKNILENLDM